MGVALAVLLTYFVYIPLPGGAGFLNFTDVIIIFSSLFFGPWIGASIGGISGLMVDLLLGYAFYAPFTLIIKFLEGLVAGFLFKIIRGNFKYIAPFVGGLLMAALYIIPDYILLNSFYSTMIGFGLNLIQGALGASLGLTIYLVFMKSNIRPPITS